MLAVLIAFLYVVVFVGNPCDVYAFFEPHFIDYQAGQTKSTLGVAGDCEQVNPALCAHTKQLQDNFAEANDFRVTLKVIDDRQVIIDILKPTR